MRSARPSTLAANPTFELVRFAKLWLIEVIENTLDPPCPAVYQFMSSVLPSYLEQAVAPKKKKAPREGSIEDLLNKLRASIETGQRAGELGYLASIKARLNRDSKEEKQEKLIFLTNYYCDILDKFTLKAEANLKSLCSDIPKSLMKYMENKEIAEKIDLRPANLQDFLQEKKAVLEKALKQKKQGLAPTASSLSTKIIQPSPPQSSRSPHSLQKEQGFFHSQIQVAERGEKMQELFTERFSLPQANQQTTEQEEKSSRASSDSTSEALPQPQPHHETDSLPPIQPFAVLYTLIDASQTLAQYHEACRQYYYHLLAAMMSEIKDLSKGDKNHSLLTFLYPKKEGTPQQIAEALLNSYFPDNQTSIVYNQTQKKIDESIQTVPPFQEVWDKIKLIKKLRETSSYQAFHILLNENNNKMILTKRRDSSFMTFVKSCGFGVASIVGLPLGIVGGAYLAYHSFFGSRATHGHLFLKEIDQFTKAGQKPAESQSGGARWKILGR